SIFTQALRLLSSYSRQAGSISSVRVTSQPPSRARISITSLLPPGEGARRADEGTAKTGQLNHRGFAVPSPQPLSQWERGFKADLRKRRTIDSPPAKKPGVSPERMLWRVSSRGPFHRTWK